VSRSKAQETNIPGVEVKVWNSVRYLSKDSSDTQVWHAPCAVVAKNDDGNMQKGVLMFAYGSNALTSGMDLAVDVFSLNPLKIALPQLRGGCSTVLPLEAIGSDFYAGFERP
jgi:hypothetical protein